PRAGLERADLAIVVLDASDPDAGRAAVAGAVAVVPRILWLHNKIDLAGDDHGAGTGTEADPLRVSALTGAGLDRLHAALRGLAGADAGSGEGTFSARARQVEALGRAAGHLAEARQALAGGTLDLAAEGLRCAHDALGEVTGRVVPDALLGHIFSTFCIGK